MEITVKTKYALQASFRDRAHKNSEFKRLKNRLFLRSEPEKRRTHMLNMLARHFSEPFLKNLYFNPFYRQNTQFTVWFIRPATKRQKAKYLTKET